MPHGQCLLWRPDLLLMHVGGDLLTVVAYFTIPITLIVLVRRREDLAFNWVFLMFSAFIFLCGITHLINVINIWHGYYFIEGLAKVLTGLVSMATAGMLIALLPQVVSMPSRGDLAKVNLDLQRAQDDLLDLNARLERKVTERTIALEKLAVTDDLTELFNRRAIMARLVEQVQSSERYDRPLSVLMCDLDDFKGINDRHGHPIGDQVLRAFSEHLRNLLREVDLPGRYGGEEFLIVLPETDLDHAVSVAERIRDACAADQTVQTDAGVPVLFYCSIGVAQWHQGESMQQLLTRVDNALYSAKEQGRNRVVSG